MTVEMFLLLAVAAWSGWVMGRVLILVWLMWLGCKVRGHDFQPRYYGRDFCVRAAYHVVDGRHVK